MQELRDILSAADSIWVYPAGALLVALSALFPPVPSTGVFVALGALAAKADPPNWALLVLAMLVGAMAGDLASYLLTRRYDIGNWQMFRGARWQKAFHVAKNRLRNHAASLVLTSRFIPLGRISMNVAAGITPIPLPKFAFYSFTAGALWAAYSVGIGALSGLVPGLSTEFAVVIAIAVSLLLGRGISAVASWFLQTED